MRSCVCRVKNVWRWPFDVGDEVGVMGSRVSCHDSDHAPSSADHTMHTGIVSACPETLRSSGCNRHE